MAVKDPEELLDPLDRAEAGMTVRELGERFDVSEEAVVAFVQTARELLGERPLTPQAARRGAIVATAADAWENELGPLLSSARVRDLLGGVSRQRVDELLRARRLIGLRDESGRRWFPGFQFHDGRPLASLIAVHWTIADSAASEWSAASWCVAPDDALGGRSPVAWVRERRDPARLASIARQDAARLAR